MRGASLEDRRALQAAVRLHGIKGLVRSDGSTLSIKATGKALVRTRVNQLQNESHLARYKAGNVTHVNVVAEGGNCKASPTCEDYEANGPYPIDEVPAPPYHLYCRCRVLPVIPR